MIRSIRLLSLVAAVVFVLASIACSSSPTPKIQVTDMRQLLPEPTALNGLTLQDTTKIYDRATVWDHLSQRAEIFLNNGLQTLVTGTYAPPDNSGSLRIEIIDFVEPVNAFTMFAMGRNSTTKTIDDRIKSYITGDMLCFLKGKHLGRLIRTGEITNEKLIEAASVVVQRVTDSTDSWPKQLILLPVEGRIPNTETLRPLDKLEHEEFPEFFGSQYVVAGDTMKFFFMVNTDVGLTTATDEFIGDKGKVDEWLMEGEIQSLVGTHPDYGNIYCAINQRNLAVVTGFSDKKAARALVESFFRPLPKQ